MPSFRVRFAPSPTGPLHIGGVRTALYNFLLAKKQGGSFILRIEDTDQMRYKPGAEEYIIQSLNWLGLIPDEGPDRGGQFGPYRQSERKELYHQYVQKLIDNSNAYYAFDTPEELDEMREALKAKGIHSPKYDQEVRKTMNNSLTMTQTEVAQSLKNSKHTTVRLKVPEGETIIFNDLIRGEIQFSSDELDDKVLLKADGMPTYHLANIVDDHLMEISHVIRGEEWLSSTAHHVLLYRAFGWEATMPIFAHLPLILKPNGQGKLSKRDGARFGFPVFPLQWEHMHDEDHFSGFREEGYLPDAVINFLAFLGWNPGTEQEIFSLEELINTFQIEQIGKSGARFDIDKAKWYNKQYIIHSKDEELAEMLAPHFERSEYNASTPYRSKFCGLMKERVDSINDFLEKGYYFFENPRKYDEKTVRKRYKPENKVHFMAIQKGLELLDKFDGKSIESLVKSYITGNNLKFGEILPILRIAISGTMKGPDIFEMMALIGKNSVSERISLSLTVFENSKTQD